MKPQATLRFLITILGSLLMAVCSGNAQTTYTWTQTATGDQDWTVAGNWASSAPFVSGSGNELMFFADTTNVTFATGGASQVVINVPTSLSMNTLTLNGKGPNNDLGTSITIGTSASTWTLGDGTTSTVNLNSTLGGGGANRDLRYTIGANLTLVGDTSGITTFTGASTSGYGAIFSGNITGVGKGITKSGSSLLVFSGTNSYTGTTSITSGVLRLASANALSGGIGTTGGTSALTINGGVLELGAGDFSRGLGTGSSQFQITGGTSGFSAYGGPRVVTVNGDASQELQWGSTHFQPGTLVLNQAFGFNANVAPYLNGSIELANKIDLNGATRTVQVGANYALISNDIRTSTGTAGLTKSGAGTLVLTGNNTYNGNTTLSAGVLSVETSNNFGSGSSNLILNGGTLQIRGTSLTSMTGLGHTVSLTNNVNVGFDIHNAANIFTVDQVLNNNNGTRTFTKSGVGTLVLNQNNTFTGATSVNAGTLVLDFTINNLSKLSDTAALTLSGGALVLKGGVGAGTNHNEVVSATTLTGNSSNSISRDGGTSTISLGAITTNIGSTLSISEANLATTTTANTNGILVTGRVTVGSHFGSNDGSNNIVAYGGYTTATTAGGGNANLVHQLTGGGTMAANLATYSLRIVNDADSDVLNLSTRSINLTNNTTLLYAGGFNDQYTINGTGFITSASGNQPFTITTYDGTTLTLNVRTSSNGAAVSKAGKGTLVMGADNSNNGLGVSMGAFYAQEGVTRLTNSNALGTAAAGTIVQGGAALELSGGIAVGAEPLSLNGAGISNNGALRNHSGNNTFAGAITIGASGARINADAGTSLTLTGGITTTLTQDVTIGGDGNTTVSTTAITGSGKLNKDGNGTLTLSATNTYTGATHVNAGTLQVTGSIATSSLTTVASGATIMGNGTTGALTIQSGGFINPGNSPGTLNTGNLIQAGLYTAEIADKTAGNFDQINVTGTVNITGGSLTALFSAGTYAANDLIFILLNDGSDAITGTYTSLAQGATVTSYGGFNWNISYTGDSGTNAFTGGNDIVLMATAIPEPGVTLLGGLSLLGLLLRRRR